MTIERMLWCHFCKKDVPESKAAGFKDDEFLFCPDCGSQIEPPLHPMPETP